MSSTPNKHRLVLRLLAASPVIFSAVALAQQPPKPADNASIQQVEVKGAAASYDARRNDTATEIVVTQEEILRNGDTTIGEVLKRLPGVTVGGVQGRGGDIRMRGLGSGYTQVMLNGEPSPPGFSLDSISPDMIERVEIMRAATAEYSTQAIAGAINIVLKKAIVTAQKEIKAGFQADNGQPGAIVNFQMSDKMGALSYAIGGGLTYGKFDRPSDSVTSGSAPNGTANLLRHGHTDNQGRFEALNLSPRVNWTLAPGEVITSQTFINVNRFNADNTERIVTDMGRLPPYSMTKVHIDSNFEMLRSDLSYTRKLEKGGKLDAKLGVNYNHRETDSPSRQFLANDVPGLDRSITSGSTDKGMTASGKYSTPLGDGHALAVGWDGAYSKRNEDRLQDETALAAGVIATDLNQVFDANVKRIAVFGQDEWSVTPQWSVYFGLRWEGIEVQSEGNTYAPVDNKSSVWSPLFQTLYKIPGSKNDQVRLGLTRTYKAPNVGSLIPRRFASNNNTQTSPDTQGNPLLKPELAWGLDLAFEHYLPGGGLMTASTYVRRINDITHNRVDQINGLWVSMPVNDGVANTHGVELEAKFPLRSMDKTLPAIELRANIARNWSDLTSVPGPNNRLDQQTPVSGTLGIDYKMDTLPLTMGASYSFQNGGPVRISEKQYAYSVPKRSLDLYALWKFNAKNQLRVALSNALHQENITESTYIDAINGGLTDRSITPTSAALRALLEMKF